MDYEIFKRQIRAELRGHKKGLTWTEIKRHLKLKQKVPNNKWVHLLEQDIGLIRSNGIWSLKR